MSGRHSDRLGQPVSYRDAGGALCRSELTPTTEEVSLPGSTLAVRHVLLPDGATLLQKWVPEGEGRSDPRLYDLLDAEIRACAALVQCYGGRRYPAELPVLVGYNVDVAEPFVLLQPYRGRPLPSRRFDLDQLRVFEVALLRALQHTAEAGIVHGAVGLPVMWWDDKTLQLVDFEHAQRVGDPRRPGGSVPHRTPEQVDGVGTADPRDDVWGAGTVITYLSIGPHRGEVDAPRQVQSLLEGVFIGEAKSRPSAAQLLARLDPAVPPPVVAVADDPLRPGRVLFDQVVERKRTAVQVAQHGRTASLPAAEAFSPVRSGRLAVVAAVVVVAVLVVAVLVLMAQ